MNILAALANGESHFADTRYYFAEKDTIAMETAGTELGRFDASAHLGIGTSGHVADRLKIQGETSDPTKYALRVTNSNDDSLFSIRNDGMISFGTEGMRRGLRFLVEDSVATIHYVNDKRSSRLDFRMQNTDALTDNEGKIITDEDGNIVPGPNANDHVVLSVFGNEDGGGVSIGTQTAPTEKLEVRGNIKFGANGEFFALGAMQNLTAIVGRVNHDGTKNSGDGFESSRSNNATGRYQVTFASAFGSNPIVLVTASGDGLDMDDNIANTFNLTTSGFEVMITDADPTVNFRPEDAPFDFIAIGQRA